MTRGQLGPRGNGRLGPRRAQQRYWPDPLGNFGPTREETREDFGWWVCERGHGDCAEFEGGPCGYVHSSRREGNNPFMPENNPFVPGGDGGGVPGVDPVGGGDEVNQPERGVPGVTPSDVDDSISGDFDDTLDAISVRVACQDCGQRGSVRIASIPEEPRCKCGSTRVDLDEDELRQKSRRPHQTFLSIFRDIHSSNPDLPVGEVRRLATLAYRRYLEG